MSENNSLQIFDFESNQVRVVEKDGEPWWVAKDVCNILDLSDVSMSVSRLDEDEKGTSKVCTPGGTQEMSIINESGLYALIVRSNKPEAKKFRKWITSEVLPAIHQHGVYMTNEALYHYITEPDQLMTIMANWKADREKRRALEAEAETNKPKVLFADSVSASNGAILIGELAKLIRQNGVDIGEKRLFEILRQDGYLIKRKGTDHNAPTQRAMELGLFRVKETAITHSDGHVTISKTTKVTGRGQLYFVNLFLNKKVA